MNTILEFLLKTVPRLERARPDEKQQEEDKWVHHLLCAQVAHDVLQHSLQHPRNSKASKFHLNQLLYKSNSPNIIIWYHMVRNINILDILNRVSSRE